MSGEELKAEREAADVDVTQDAIAREMDVSVKTVQRIEAAESVKRSHVTAYRAALSRIAQRNERPDNFGQFDRSAPQLPDALRARIRQFVMQMGFLGADEEEMNYMDTTLHSPHVASLVLMRPDGTWRPPDEIEVEFALMLRSIRGWLQLHVETRGGALLDQKRDAATETPTSPHREKISGKKPGRKQA